jgi:hypothetical protein
MRDRGPDAKIGAAASVSAVTVPTPNHLPGPIQAGSDADDPAKSTWARRRVLAFGLGGVAAVVAAGATGLELVSHGVLPGKQRLD